ncbi:AraC family transcriptional regulator [Maribellus maritimus]|uniref:AraC family transcriptional regulator n=1 Tax=Maribellus maritimus TaxID=2870838 RepID=UPI001EEB5152|nr:AraC family transcriptional regulator [Maribellus maritimus]MCG6187357.1 AraC family transcriptional regulator [Maribellus maritimus]
MKILPFKIAKPADQSIWIQNDLLPHLYDILHQHNEFQITLIKESTGNVIAGNQFIAFQPGDIFVFGSGLPHALRNDPEYYHEENGLTAQALSIYFESEVFGNAFWNLPETKMIKEYMQKARRGLFYPGSFHPKEAEIIEKVSKENQINRLLLTLQLVTLLSKSNHGQILATEGMYNNLNETDEKRLDAVFRFTLNEFYRPISLEEVAGVSNMTVNSFCRYFKTRTRKTYIDFLTEYRIGQACKLLQQEEFNISDICYRVGFGNLSNFNRKFKEINGCTPKQFRKRQMLQNLTN